MRYITLTGDHNSTLLTKLNSPEYKDYRVIQIDPADGIHPTAWLEKIFSDENNILRINAERMTKEESAPFKKKIKEK
jgi:hypothetical protein